VAFGDHRRAAALVLVARRLHPAAYARFLDRFAAVLPPAIVAGSRGSTCADLPLRGDDDAPGTRDHRSGCARATQLGLGPADKGES
jgi:hypothetical protein